MPPAALPHAFALAGAGTRGHGHGHGQPARLTLDTAACAAVFERARATDLLILCCE